jgi:hypothetical protein
MKFPDSFENVSKHAARGNQLLTLERGALVAMTFVYPRMSDFTPGPIPLPFEPTRQSAGYFDCCHKEAM